MKLFVAIVLALATPAAADPLTTAAATTAQLQDRSVTRAYVALESADREVARTRAVWDAAVAAGHPVAAGEWARRHFDAMQVRRAALEAWHQAVRRAERI